MKKLFWNIIGFISLGMAYIGLITPGIPYSPFIVFSAYCFSKGSERMHRWIYNHKLFGPFLTNWSDQASISSKDEILYVAMMSLSLY
jgi:uncharacterized protein